MSAVLPKLCWSLSWLVVPVVVEAQFIALKTVPIASGEQFLIFPSANIGMGGVSLAVDDPMLDPWINPAKTARVSGGRIHGTPTFYSLNDDQGGARTMPAALLFTGSKVFGGASVAVQQVDRGNRGIFNFIEPATAQLSPETLLRDRTATNTYLSGQLGGKVGTGSSIAVAFGYSDLNTVDGVDRLYARSQNVRQDGHVSDYRLGYLRDFGGDRSLEALVLHSRTRMQHDVTYIDRLWDPVLRRTRTSIREEVNLDRTNTYGLHVGYRRPLYQTGWKIGGIVTVNYKTHPKIPNYEIQNIPRDPGDSWAYNLGVGVSRKLDRLEWGADLIYEPVWSHTWAEAGTPVRNWNGALIPVGGRTVENDFVFANKVFRIGVNGDGEVGSWQVGLNLRRISYSLEQVNLIQGTQRDQDEAWTEFTPTWSGALKFPEFSLRYSGYLTTNSLGGGARTEVIAAPVAPDGIDYIAAPSAPISMRDSTVWVHQISISIPVQRTRR